MRTTRAVSALVAFLAAAGLAAAAEKATGTKAGRTRVVRSWVEAAPAGSAGERHVSYEFDYDKGAFRRVVRDASGKTLESRAFAPGEIDVRPSNEEIAEAFGMVRNDPELSRVLDKVSGQLMGGFVLNEGPGQPCGPGSRCIHVQINTEDGWGIVRWVVVDLAKGTFAYRGYRPEMSQGGVK